MRLCGSKLARGDQDVDFMKKKMQETIDDCFAARNIRDNEALEEISRLNANKKSSKLYIFGIAFNFLSHPRICPSVKLYPCVSNVTDILQINRQFIQAIKQEN